MLEVTTTFWTPQAFAARITAFVPSTAGLTMRCGRARRSEISNDAKE
jgi:hypothetical protein